MFKCSIFFFLFLFFSLTCYIVKKSVLPETVDLKKYSQPESWELYFNWWAFVGLQVQETASQVTLREQLWGSEGSIQVIYKFCNKGQVTWTSKEYCFLKKTQISQVKEISTFLCMERYKGLGWLRSFLWQAPHLSWASYPVFFTFRVSSQLDEWLKSDGC